MSMQASGMSSLPPNLQSFLDMNTGAGVAPTFSLWKRDVVVKGAENNPLKICNIFKEINNMKKDQFSNEQKKAIVTKINIVNQGIEKSMSSSGWLSKVRSKMKRVFRGFLLLMFCPSKTNFYGVTTKELMFNARSGKIMIPEWLSHDTEE